MEEIGNLDEEEKHVYFAFNKKLQIKAKQSKKY